jgi:ribosomal-protein-alanine N-acetyltransferase
MGDRFQIRSARDDDIPFIVDLERRVFSDPWNAAACRAFLGADSLVATAGGRVVGYVFARRAADQAEILNLAVEPDLRREGVGRALVAAVLAQMGNAGVAAVYLEVRASNRAARALYAELGFEDVGLRRRYYHRPVEDAIVMSREIAPHRTPQRNAPSRVSSVDKRT